MSERGSATVEFGELVDHGIVDSWAFAEIMLPLELCDGMPRGVVEDAVAGATIVGQVQQAALDAGDLVVGIQGTYHEDQGLVCERELDTRHPAWERVIANEAVAVGVSADELATEGEAVGRVGVGFIAPRPELDLQGVGVHGNLDLEACVGGARVFCAPVRGNVELVSWFKDVWIGASCSESIIGGVLVERLPIRESASASDGREVVSFAHGVEESHVRSRVHDLSAEIHPALTLGGVQTCR